MTLDSWWIDFDRRVHHDDGVTDRIDTYKRDTIFTEAGERLRLGKLQPALREFLDLEGIR